MTDQWTEEGSGSMLSTTNIITAQVQDTARKPNRQTHLTLPLNRGSSALPIGAGHQSGVVWGTPARLANWHVTGNAQHQ